MTDREAVVTALAAIADPSGGGDIVASGRVSGVVVKADGSAGLVLSVEALARDVAERLNAAVELAVRRVPGVTAARIILTAERDTAPAAAADVRTGPVPGIRTIVAVASGKGGVGKSTVAANLAVALARRGLSVGLLDADIYGPSVPTLLGLTGRGKLEGKRLQPAAAHGITALSMGMMTDPTKAIIWRGPMAASAMMQMVEQTDWGVLDTLVIDLPPGTGDIQLTMAQKLKPTGAVIVSTPQDLALIDARRAIAMFGEVKVPVIGLVENMSSFVCPACGVRTDIFGHGGAGVAAEAAGIAFLGGIPLDIAIRTASDAGQPPAAGEGALAEAFAALAEQVAAGLGL
ncbi:Mrp/NBP35 family ATP-binding protein [Polymorphobacter sp. PAMC 29334]|uniref:Mrp/NBP35 family ATP-binding protein n=1 Tax=Polymorphobacter sp. PAMC 29334 TaxID=2862331 RepID=UPI001D032B1E|nr:Mrp/NBP35 family ATP-binding protein [Polymorphobacter sp. PAMC 29334]